MISDNSGFWSRDARIGVWLAAVPLLLWAGFFLSRVIDLTGSAAWLWLGLVVASFVCTPPLILYTVRCVRQPVPAWRKTVMVAGGVGGVLSYFLPVLVLFRD